MQDRKDSDSGYLVPGTWYLTAVSHSHISNLNKALLHHPFLTFEYAGLPSIPRICSLPRGDTPKGNLDGALQRR
jgi:hypothetical protein